MKRYVEKQVNDGMRNGLHLDEAKKDEIKAVKKRISELGVEFNKNLNEDTAFILLDQTELRTLSAPLKRTKSQGS